MKTCPDHDWSAQLSWPAIPLDWGSRHRLGPLRTPIRTAHSACTRDGTARVGWHAAERTNHPALDQTGAWRHNSVHQICVVRERERWASDCGVPPGPGLLPLISRMADVDRVVTAGLPSPACDVHAPLVNFPASFPEARRPISANPVPISGLIPEKHGSARLSRAARADGTICLSDFVGLAMKIQRLWRLDLLPCGSSAGGIRGYRRSEARQSAGQWCVAGGTYERCPHGHRIEHLGDTFFSISDAAAVITNLDLVITVDTMLAHLAGSLGVSVWTILGYPPELDLATPRRPK